MLRQSKVDGKRFLSDELRALACGRARKETLTEMVSFSDQSTAYPQAPDEGCAYVGHLRLGAHHNVAPVIGY